MKPTSKYNKSDIKDDTDVQRIIQYNSETGGIQKNTCTELPPHMPCNYTDKAAYTENVKSRLHVDNQLLEMRRTLDKMLDNTESKDSSAMETKHIVKEWKLVAQALDRVFFLVYIVCIIVSLVTLFPRPPWWSF